MTSPATMQMRTSAWRDAIGGASRRVGGRAGRGVSQSREERAVGGVQGSPDWFEWTQTAELPPAPPVYPSARLPVYPSSRLPVLPVYPSATVLPVFPPSRLPGFPARSRLLTIWSLYGLLSSSLLASQKPSPMSYGWQSRPGLGLRARLLQLGGFTRLSSTPMERATRLGPRQRVKAATRRGPRGCGVPPPILTCGSRSSG